MKGRRAIAMAVLLVFVGLPVPLHAVAMAENSTRDHTELLTARFLAALHAAWNPESYEYGELLAEILTSIEKDYGYNLHSGMLRRELEHLRRRRPAAPAGIAHFKPIEADSGPAKKTGDLATILQADVLTARCVPSEAAYNERYLTFLESKRWPKENFASAHIRYSFYLRMLQRGCVSEEAFRAVSEKLIPAIQKLMAAESLAGNAGIYIYLLAASKKFDTVPKELLRRYLEAQRADGSWPYENMPDVAIVAAQGAYIIAAMLHRNGVHVSSQEIFRAESIKPSLPEPVPYSAGFSRLP